MRYFQTFLILILMGASFIAGGVVFSGYSRTFIPEQGFFGQSPKGQLSSDNLIRVYQFLNDNYLYKDQIQDLQDLEDGAIKGIVASLEDPYTVYFSAEEYQEFNESLNGTFEGIGAEIGIQDEQLIVISPIDGTPAARAGLQPQDQILAIDSQSTIGLSVEEAVTKIRGPKGTKVTLTVRKSESSEAREISITRELINVPNVTSRVRDGVGIIEIGQFQKDTSSEVDQELSLLTGQGITQIVLDLRFNPGGYLESAVELVDLFVPANQTVVIEQGRNDTVVDELKTRRSAKYPDLELVVLINKGSASASEITAGALRDIKGTKLIGETSFGKGVVQGIKEFSDGDVLKYTTAKWLTPSGQMINEQGLKPDLEVLRSLEDIEQDRDPQLDRAIEELKK